MHSAPGAALEGVGGGDRPEPGPDPVAPSGVAGGARAGLLVAGLLAVLAVPLLVALGAMREPRWFPVLDLAQTELRVRDVATADAPLIGLAGRIVADGHQGSHPGPLSFFLLWPFYQAFGASAWALQGGAVSLHAVAMGAALWIGYRRGGVGLVLGMAAVLAVLARAYGATTLTQPWNPYLPVLAWMVFLLAVWSVVCDDLPMLPVGVLAGSFCAQTHISYLILILGLGVAAVAGAFVSARNRRRDARERRRFGRWVLAAAVVGGVLWLPPVVDEIANSPGNLSIIAEYFGDPDEDPIGLREGIDILLVHLNPWRLVETQPAALAHRGEEQLASRWPATASVVPGVLVLAGWGASVVLAWRLRHRSLLRLDLVLAVALVLGVVTLSRIFGFVWYYLSLWSAGLAALMILAAVWTVAAAVGPRLGGARDRAATAGKAALAGGILVLTLLFTVDAAHVEPPDPKMSSILSAVVPQTVEAVERGSAPGGGPEGRYLVTWADPIAIGSQGYGLLNELERAGLDVGTLDIYAGSATAHRVRDASAATAEVHLAIGLREIRAWREKPGAVQVAFVDPRGRTGRAEFERLRARVIDDLEAAGLAELVPRVDDNLFVVTVDERVPRPTRDRMVRMFDLGLPTAVFIGPTS